MISTGILAPRSPDRKTPEEKENREDLLGKNLGTGILFTSSRLAPS